MLLDADQLQYHRAKCCLSLRELASLSGVSRDAISLFERGERDPLPRTIRKLAYALGIEPADLIAWDDGGGD